MLAEAGHFGPEFGVTEGTDASGKPFYKVGNYLLKGVRSKGGVFKDLDKRIEQMDAACIDFQVLSPSPLLYFHHIEAAKAIEYCRHHNDAMAKLIALHPGRLAGFAALPMQDPKAASDELRRAVSELGLLGAAIGTDHAKPLHDSCFDPLYETFVALDVPLYIHPAPAGIDGPMGDPNLRNFDLDLVCGFAAQEMIAVSTLIYGGVLERHPDIDICVSHGGGGIAFLYGRLALAAAKRPWAPAALQKDGAFEAALTRLWFDTHLNGQRALELLIDVVGTSRLVYGTNFAGWDAPDAQHPEPVLPVLADNARRLLRFRA
jgi:aminocarboxymuconate-semialdehyde decarboxylase